MWSLTQLGLFDLMTILSFIPVVEYLVTKLLLYGSCTSTPLPVTIMFPIGFAAARFISIVDNPYYVGKFIRFLYELFSIKNLFPNLVYLGMCIICGQLLLALWSRRIIIGKL